MIKMCINFVTSIYWHYEYRLFGRKESKKQRGQRDEEKDKEKEAGLRKEGDDVLRRERERLRKEVKEQKNKRRE